MQICEDVQQEEKKRQQMNKSMNKRRTSRGNARLSKSEKLKSFLLKRKIVVHKNGDPENKSSNKKRK